MKDLAVNFVCGRKDSDIWGDGLGEGETLLPGSDIPCRIFPPLFSPFPETGCGPDL